MSTKFPVVLEGNLTNAPTLERSPDGVVYGRFPIAVNPRVKDESGTWVDAEPEFYAVTMFGQAAENSAAQLGKGDRIVVAGEMTIRQYTDKQGNPAFARQVVADHIGASTRFADAVKVTPRAASAAPNVSEPHTDAWAVDAPTEEPSRSGVGL